jgi:predicted ribosomally synthesized peptide with nif11-like leader
MTREVARFQEAVRSNPALARGIQFLSTPEAVSDYALGHGFDFSAGELEGWVKEHRDELDELELGGIVGGVSSLNELKAAGVPTAETVSYLLFLK